MRSLIRSKRAFFLLLCLSAVALTGFGCRRPDSQPGASVDSLVVWGLWQDSAMMDPVIAAYKEQTGIDVEYRKIASVAAYERSLLEALAEGRGPDVFVIHHTWVEGKRGIMSPAPPEIINERMLREEFVPVVAEDSIRDGFVYSLPTSVDTLALFYNEDMLNAAGIAHPPRSWTEFQQTVERLTSVSRLGVVQQSGAALGTATNVNRAQDILQLLMLQSGLSIVDSSTDEADFVNDVGERALEFYTDFANRSKRVFTWDLQQDYSIDAFAEGKVAMMFNYSYHIPTIQAKNPRLRFAIARMPQIVDSRTVMFANYWPFAVSSASRSPQAAWHFLRFMTNADSARVINEAQSAPPARRDGIQEAQTDRLLGVFAEQSLQAATWPRVDIVAVDAIFNTMIDDVVRGATIPGDALRSAASQLNQLRSSQ